jgi:peroxiredoxin
LAATHRILRPKPRKARSAATNGPASPGGFCSHLPRILRRSAQRNSVSHDRWAADIADITGYAPNYPIIGDPELKVAKLYGMLPAGAGDKSEGRTPADNQTVRNVYVIGPDKKIKLMIAYPMTTGRNFDEILRVIDSLQLTAEHQVATPVNWKQGDDVIITAAVSDEEAKKRYPDGWKAPRPYIRIVPQPGH